MVASAFDTSLAIVILHGVPGGFLQEFCGRRVDAGEIAVADGGAPGQRRKQGTGGKVGSDQARVALVRRIEIEFGLLLRTRAKASPAGITSALLALPATV